MIKLGMRLSGVNPNKVQKHSLRAEGWETANPVFWQPERGGPYELLTNDEVADFALRLAEHGRMPSTGGCRAPADADPGGPVGPAGVRVAVARRKNGSMEDLNYADSIVIACPADALYDMIADVTRMGEWSPVCKACWWDEGDAPRVGAWFTGRNETPERTWETRSEVVAADRGREFAFVVGGSWIRWGYAFDPVDGGTKVTESWEFLPAGVARFEERFGEDAPAQIADRIEAAHRGIPATLAAIKVAAEAENPSSGSAAEVDGA